MKKTSLIHSIILCLMLASLSIVYGQETKEPTKQTNKTAQEETIKINSFLVNLPMVVSDKDGRYLPNLSKVDFNIFENNVEQEIAFFSNEEVPFFVVLIIDCSGSTGDTLTDIRAAARELIKGLKDQDQASILTFADNVVVNQSFTSDKSKLLGAIDTISSVGSTKLYDSVYLAARDILPKVNGRKALVLLTDGQDTSSSHNRQEAIDRMVESGSLAYVVQYPLPNETNFLSASSDIDAPRNPLGENADIAEMTPRSTPNVRSQRSPASTPRENNKPDFQPSSKRPPDFRTFPVDSGFLSSITEVTGGRFYKSNIGNLSVPMRSIGEELRNVYVVSYYPSNPIENKGVRKIKVKPRKDLKAAIRYRSSYNAEKIAKTLSK